MALPVQRSMSWSDRFARTMVCRHLSGLRDGCLHMVEGSSSTVWGDVGADLTATITVHNPRFFSRILWAGGLGAAESLMDGEWECSDLTAFVRIFIRNLSLADRVDRGTAWLRRQFARVAHAWRRNSVDKARQNIRKHYDLSNAFYKLWLDETLTYSCGFFETPQTTMREASLSKIDLACRKLRLSPTDHLVEIGTGWGALSIHAASHYGCRVTTTTISDAQHALAKERIESAGLADRITLLKQDYRNLHGEFDKLVSIEMIEAVGHHYFPNFFEQCSRLLKPDGAALIQAIVISDARYREHLRSVDFIREYIFPGGCLPSVSSMTLTASEAGNLRLVHLEDYAPHYAETLRRWHRSFIQEQSAVRELGFDDRFIRMWRYYLTYCEAVFEERQVNLVQALYAKPKCTFDPFMKSSLHDDPCRTRTLSGGRFYEYNELRESMKVMN